MSRSIMSRREGITLLEVLVIVGMMAILAGLLFPVLARVRARAVDVECVSRLVAVYTALTAYMADYDRRYPIVYYWYPDRDDPDFVRWVNEIALRRGWPIRRIPPNVFKPPWPPPPPPPSWYTPRVAMRDYVEDEKIWFCPTQKTIGYPGPPGVHSEMGYTYEESLSGARIDELTWPLHEVPVLIDLHREWFPPDKKRPGHTGTGCNSLRLDGSVVKVRVPLQGVCVRLPWKYVERRVRLSRGEQ